MVFDDTTQNPDELSDEDYYYLESQKKKQGEKAEEEAAKEEQSHKKGPSTFGSVIALAGVPFLRHGPQIIEETQEYNDLSKKILKEKKLDETSLKGKNLAQSDLDYLYGSLNNPSSPSLHQDITGEIRKRADLYTQYANDKNNNTLKQFKDYEKYKKLLEEHEKLKKETYRDANYDPAVVRLRTLAQQEADQRFELRKKTDPTLIGLDKKGLAGKKREILDQIEEKRWDEFVERYPEKAIEYSSRKGDKHDQIRSALERQKQRTSEKEIQEKQQVQQISTISAPQTIEKTILVSPGGDTISEIEPGAAPQSSSAEPSASHPQAGGGSNLARNAGQNFARKKAAKEIEKKGGKKAAEKALSKILKNRTKKILSIFMRIFGAGGWIVPAVVGGIILLTIIIVLLSGLMGGGGIGGIGGTTGGTGGTGGTTGGTGGNIASCTFYRSGDPTPGAKFQSNLLLSYINDAANLSTIPAVVLAAFIRVESPASLTKSDAEIAGFCPESVDGSLGLMQLVPQFSPRTDAICYECLQNGARLLGTTVDQLTKSDYCDPRKNVILGAGFILQKMKYLGYGDGTSWNQQWTTDLNALQALAKGYYGCSLYPSCQNGPYDYGRDLYTSISNCNPQNSGLVGSSTIVQAASGISQQLSLGIDICARNYPPTNNRCYDAKPNEGITGDGTNNNTYWCTFLIVDSYSNTGSGLSRSAQGAVFNMKAFFQNQSQNGGKLKFLPADTSVQSLFPGDVIFFEGSGQHVSLIKSIDIDSNGDGAIHTYDSNNIVLEDTVTVKSYNVISAWSTSSIYSITGFGHLL